MILSDIAKSFFKDKISPDGTAVDFTMGNGNDTLFLSRLVPQGRVYAFDIQKEALLSTRRRLEENGVENVMLINSSHANVKDYVKVPINAGMFNLGYLPGGDKTIHTMTDSTLIAVSSALELLAPHGVLTVLVYPGHEEGALEGERLCEMFSLLDRRDYSILQCKMINSPLSPFIIAVERSGKV